MLLFTIQFYDYDFTITFLFYLKSQFWLPSWSCTCQHIVYACFVFYWCLCQCLHALIHAMQIERWNKLQEKRCVCMQNTCTHAHKNSDNVCVSCVYMFIGDFVNVYMDLCMQCKWWCAKKYWICSWTLNNMHETTDSLGMTKPIYPQFEIVLWLASITVQVA